MVNRAILMTALMMGSVMADPNLTTASKGWFPWAKKTPEELVTVPSVESPAQGNIKDLIDSWKQLSAQRSAFDGSGRYIDESQLKDLESKILERLKTQVGMQAYWDHAKKISDVREKMYLWLKYEQDVQNMRENKVSPDAIMLVKRSANEMKKEIESEINGRPQLIDLWAQAQSLAKPVKVVPRNPALDSFKEPEPVAPHIQAAQLRCDAARAKLRDFMRYRVAGQPMTQEEKDQFDLLEQNQRDCDNNLHSMKNQDPIWP